MEETKDVKFDQVEEEEIQDLDDGVVDHQDNEEVDGGENTNENDDLGIEDLLPPKKADRGKSNQREKQVPLKALKAERSKRQQYERQLQELMNMHRELLSRLDASKQKAEEPEDDVGISDDDVITGADLKKILERERARLQQEQSKMTVNQALVMAKKQYPDFDDVVALADDLITSNPALKGLANYILQSPEAPFIAYELGKLHPNYQRRASNGLGNRLQQNMNSPRPVKRGAPEVSDLAARIEQLDPLSEEFAELDRRIKSKFGG